MLIVNTQARLSGGQSRAAGSCARAHAPRTAQESIPYKGVYGNGIIETSRGVYTKSYRLPDVEFDQASQNEQIRIFDSYCETLNQLASSVGRHGKRAKIEITVYARRAGAGRLPQVLRDAQAEHKGDRLDNIRDDINRMILNAPSEAAGGADPETILTLTVEEDNAANAERVFRDLECRADALIAKTTNGGTPVPLTAKDRLSLLYEIYNPGIPVPFAERARALCGLKKDAAWTLGNLGRFGHTTKDTVAPKSMWFGRDTFQVGSWHGCALSFSRFSSQIRTDCLTRLSSLYPDMLVSVHYAAVPQEKAVRLLKTKRVNIEAEALAWASKRRIPDLCDALDSIKDTLRQVESGSEVLFLTTIVVTVFADTNAALKERVTGIEDTVENKFHMGRLSVLAFQQESGFAASLPLGVSQAGTNHLFATPQAAAFLPYSAKDIIEPRGLFYGTNTQTNRPVLLDRRRKMASGMICGVPGSGSTDCAKAEILNVLVHTDDTVFVIDPEREYRHLAEKLGGSVVQIDPGSGVYINPMDLDLRGQDPLSAKSDYIASLCETALGRRTNLTPEQRAAIDHCVRMLYGDYIRELDARNAGRDKDQMTFIDRNLCPTLTDFYNELRGQYTPETKYIAMALERYTIGSLDSFAKKTNTQTGGRFVVYDTKDLGIGMADMAAQICLGDIWNRLIETARENRRTWIYVNSPFLWTNSALPASVLNRVFAQAGQWNGIVTLVTAHPIDFLEQKETMAILSRSEFAMMLSQSPVNRDKLRSCFALSDLQTKAITRAEPGHGLIRFESDVVPFAMDLSEKSPLRPYISV